VAHADPRFLKVRASVQSPTSSASAVLVIDDDPALLDSFATVLGTYGIPTTTARDGREGLAAFRRVSPAVVLTDIVMPERDGLETIMAMRRERPAAKIIAMSGGGLIGKSGYLAIAKQLGADAVIHKPFDVDELVKLIRTFLHASTSRLVRA
jgi:two-component system chemotaxis response regulator CheY